MCLSVGRASPSVQSVGYAVLFPPLAWIRDLWLGDRLIPLTRQGLSPASFFTVLVKTREALSDILPHEVGEMAGRPEGGAASSHHSRIRAPRYELAEGPLLVAGSSRPPAVASGGQEMGPLSLHKPWIEAEAAIVAPASGPPRPRLCGPRLSRVRPRWSVPTSFRRTVSERDASAASRASTRRLSLSRSRSRVLGSSGSSHRFSPRMT